MRGEIFITEDQNKDERVMRKRVLSTINAPCVNCHLQDICRPDGFVNPKGCIYLVKW